jgi:hypothetical protein
MDFESSMGVMVGNVDGKASLQNLEPGNCIYRAGIAFAPTRSHFLTHGVLSETVNLQKWRINWCMFSGVDETSRKHAYELVWILNQGKKEEMFSDIFEDVKRPMDVCFLLSF